MLENVVPTHRISFRTRIQSSIRGQCPRSLFADPVAPPSSSNYTWLCRRLKSGLGCILCQLALLHSN
ncbi:hypothetical protein GYMLUDRAFT_39908 [Collybiopsis luxurians FD-317 M1]|nr:hypothetical protein GYMLUDRAFT_39908 [Collybiopsis luxurians FD-317 M1]